MSHTQDVLDRTEVRLAKNGRSGEYGGIADREGSQRIHTTVLAAGAPILGLKQWVPTGGRQVVAIAGGNLYYQNEGSAEFTQVASTFSTTVRPDFETHRVGGAPRLFIADGTLRMWDGTNLTTVANSPPALRLQVYKTRLFAITGDKFLFASATDDPEEWSTTFGAIFAPVETYSDEGLIAIEVVGSSLLLYKENSIARFTGVSSADIRLDQETEGISPDIGAVAPNAVRRMEEVAFFLSDRGAYIATESGVKPVAVEIEPAFDVADRDHLPNAVSVPHRGRREMWVFFPEKGETENTVGWCFNWRLGVWHGPWDFGGFNVCSAAEFERADGQENVLLGGYDGFIRQGDVPEVGCRDDVLADGTGGNPVSMTIEFPHLVFGDPSVLKRLPMPQQIVADLGESGHLITTFQGDRMRARSRTLKTRGPGIEQYLVRPGVSGRRITLTLTNDTGQKVQVNAVLLEAEMGRRYV